LTALGTEYDIEIVDYNTFLNDYLQHISIWNVMFK
jgi:hypothetical protein